MGLARVVLGGMFPAQVVPVKSSHTCGKGVKLQVGG